MGTLPSVAIPPPSDFFVMPKRKSLGGEGAKKSSEEGTDEGAVSVRSQTDYSIQALSQRIIEFAAPVAPCTLGAHTVNSHECACGM